MQKITKVIVTDGGPLELATSILALAYGVGYGDGAADSLKRHLGLDQPKATLIENAFSYPNSVAMLKDEHGRSSIYVFDSTQETLAEGGQLVPLDPSMSVGEVKPAADPTTAAPARTLDATTATGTAPAPGFVPDTPPAAPATPLADTSDGPTAPPAEPAAIVPGKTPGYPADAVSGEPIKLTDEQHAELAQHTIGPDDGTMALGTGQASAPLAGAGDLPAEAAGDQGSAEGEAAEAGRDPANGLIDPNAETLQPVTAQNDPAFDEGVSAAKALQPGQVAPANPYGDDQPEKRSAWTSGFVSVPAPSEGGDQAGFHSTEG